MVFRYPNDWLVGYREVQEANLRLFCFPFAGGNARLFRHWPHQLPATVEVLTVQLPGRGHRMGAPRVENWEELLGVLGEAISDLTDKPFAFFGHSLGALVAFEMARHLRRAGRKLPSGLFVSACGAPQGMKPPADPLHLLPDDQLLERVKIWGGVPPEIFNYPKAIPLFIHPLREDLRLMETYQYREEAPLFLPIDVFGGRQDVQVPESDLEGWKNQTRDKFLLTMVDGDHFFIESNPEVLVRTLSDWAEFYLAYKSF